MPREYRHIKQYENELLDLRNQGQTYKEIADRMGFSKKQIEKFFERYRINQRKIKSGKAIHKRGRPCKNTDNGIPPSIQKLDNSFKKWKSRTNDRTTCFFKKSRTDHRVFVF